MAAVTTGFAYRRNRHDPAWQPPTVTNFLS